MTAGSAPSAASRARLALLELGAAGVGHVNGDLLAHLQGTQELLRRWGAPQPLQMAGLYHAVYGTAGLADQLLPLDRRRDVAALIGEEAEALVYLFCACDRADFYPRLARRERPLRLRDRFTGTLSTPAPARVASLCELTLANEIELLEKMAGAPPPRFAAFLGALFAALEPRLRPAVARECGQLLARAGVSGAGGSAPPAPLSNSR